ncbi:hypothetical protein RJ639_017084 [Escallonia herrerae]|uniref:Uncharacterized protein n=1 Tax=Escallonia herrerae TaxID=1293975 RepID=A0AA88VED1_9ASTE|nr:hypothetical protein RJ639_017084 [Escallonia herrerae]
MASNNVGYLIEMTDESSIQKEHAKVAATSIESILKGSSNVGAKGSDVAATVDVCLVHQASGFVNNNILCENIFSSVHRYSDKHGCTFDYRATARDAIARAKLVVKAQKSTKSRVVFDCRFMDPKAIVLFSSIHECSCWLELLLGLRV